MVPLEIAGKVSGRSAYDVEGNQLCVVYIKVDGYILRPASRCKDGASGHEVVNGCACAAPQQDSFAECPMRCPHDDGNLASA